MAVVHSPGKHWPTPTKTAVRTAIKLRRSIRATARSSKYGTNRQLFKDFSVPSTTAYRMARSIRDRRTLEQETRGRKDKLTPKDIKYIELVVVKTGYDGRVLSWA